MRSFAFGCQHESNTKISYWKVKLITARSVQCGRLTLIAGDPVSYNLVCPICPKCYLLGNLHFYCRPSKATIIFDVSRESCKITDRLEIPSARCHLIMYSIPRSYNRSRQAICLRKAYDVISNFCLVILFSNVSFKTQYYCLTIGGPNEWAWAVLLLQFSSKSEDQGQKSN